jgi:hypothetical protein
VGASIVTSQLLAAAVRAGNIGAAWALVRYRAWRATEKSGCLTQDELVESLRWARR